MNANNKLQEIIEYLQDGSNYDKENFINNISMSCKDSKALPPDELSIVWDRDIVGDLHSYNNEFFDKVIKSIVHVINSYKTECKQNEHEWISYEVSTGYYSYDIEQAGYCKKCGYDTHGEYFK